MTTFATGKYALALCDRCGQQFKFNQLRQEWNGLKTCPQCFETKHPQLDPSYHSADPQALPRAASGNGVIGHRENDRLVRRGRRNGDWSVRNVFGTCVTCDCKQKSQMVTCSDFVHGRHFRRITELLNFFSCLKVVSRQGLEPWTY